jgi:hypothetical protein
MASAMLCSVIFVRGRCLASLLRIPSCHWILAIHILCLFRKLVSLVDTGTPCTAFMVTYCAVFSCSLSFFPNV